jgi:hypothetical protein
MCIKPNYSFALDLFYMPYNYGLAHLDLVDSSTAISLD